MEPASEGSPDRISRSELVFQLSFKSGVSTDHVPSAWSVIKSSASLAWIKNELLRTRVRTNKCGKLRTADTLVLEKCDKTVT
jgi:hypothetical protein